MNICSRFTSLGRASISWYSTALTKLVFAIKYDELDNEL